MSGNFFAQITSRAEIFFADDVKNFFGVSYHVGGGKFIDRNKLTKKKTIIKPGGEVDDFSWFRSGIISSEVFAVPLEDMDKISYEQGFLGQMLRYGTFHFHSVAIAGISACSGISNPEMVKAVIEQEISKKKKSEANVAKSETNIVINQTFGQKEIQ